MKRISLGKIAACLLMSLFTCLSVQAQKDGITPLFTAGDSALFRYDTIGLNGDTVSVNVGMKVLFAAGATADIEFNTTSVAGWDNGNILPRLLNDIQSICRPVIEYQNGQPIKVLNLDELKESVDKATRHAIDVSLAEKQVSDGLGDSLKAAMSLLMKDNITAQGVMYQYANLMMPKMKMGETTEKRGNIVVTCRLDPGAVNGEFNLNHKTIAKYSQKEITAIAAGSSTDVNGVVAQVFGGGEIAVELLKMTDSVTIVIESNGVLLRNGVAKYVETVRTANITAEGETAEMSSKSIVKLISEYGLTEIRPDFHNYSQIVATKDKDRFLICYDLPLFGWVTRKISTDLATALFGTSNMTMDKACKEYLSPFTVTETFHSSDGLLGLWEGTRKRLNKECGECQTFAIDWKGIVCGSYASCVVRIGKEKTNGRNKGKKTESSKALLWNLRTGKLLTMEDVFTPSVVSEIAALGGENHQVLMHVNGKLVLFFYKDGKPMEATFSFVSNEDVFNSQFAELVSEDAKRVEELFSKAAGSISVNKNTGELFAFDFAGRISRPQLPRRTSASTSPPMGAKVSLYSKDEKLNSGGDYTKVFDMVEQMPAFPGGPSALFEYLSKNVKYPPVAEENGVQGRVIVGFVVERDGSIADVNIVKSVDPSLDKEAVRVIKSMPRWIPGKQKGETVSVKYTVPVIFKLQETTKKKKK